MTQSIMEQKMSRLGWPSRTRPSRQPPNLENGLIEIGYLKALEAVEHKRQHILTKILNASVTYGLALQKERHSLEKIYVRVEKLPTIRREPVQTINPKSHEEIMEEWKDKSQEEIDKMISDLEALVKP